MVVVEVVVLDQHPVQHLEIQVDLVVVEHIMVVVVDLGQEELETHHQHHHHREILVVLVIGLVEQHIMPVEVVVLAVLVEMLDQMELLDLVDLEYKFLLLSKIHQYILVLEQVLKL
jgi:hypothetical protein